VLQRLALRSLVHLKTPELAPHLQSILALTDAKSLRSNLARLDLQAGGVIPEADRGVVVPVVIRVLFPCMRKRSARFGGLGAAGSARAAILNKLGCLEVEELVTVAALFLAPLAAAVRWEVGWEERLLEGGAQEWLARASPVAAAAAGSRRRQAALNAISDLLQHLGFRLSRLLSAFAAIVLSLLEAAAAAAAAAAPAAPERALRAQALRVLAGMLKHFAAELDWRPYWPRLLAAAAPLAAQPFADGGGGVPPLMALVCAIASSPQLLPVLAGHPQLQGLPAVPPASPAVDARGSELLRAAVATLGAADAPAVARDAVLCAVENVLEGGDATVECVLRPVVDDLVKALHARIMHAGAGPRDVVLLQRICPLVRDDGSAEALAAVLVAAAARQRRGGVLALQTLQALAALWRRKPHDTAAAASAAEAAALKLAPLAARRGSAALRAALAEALAAATSRLPVLATAAEVLRASAAAAADADGDDGIAALDAYGALTTVAWAAQVPTVAAVLVHVGVHDAGAPADLSLRSAAVGALARFIEAAGDHPHLSSTAQTAFYRLLLFSVSTSATASVRSEFLALARRLAEALPESFPDLASLMNEDPEVDFFFNVCHVQLHRRTRALQRLQQRLQDPDVRTHPFFIP
jgi:U3 small nucleolar RNA-associated protein 20